MRFRSPLLAVVCAFCAWSQPVISTYAGANHLFTDDGRQANALFLSKLAAVTVDPNGNPVIPVPQRNVVLRINADGTVTRLAGTGNPGISPDGTPALNSTLNDPRSAAYDSSGNLYVADADSNRIIKVAPSGTMTTFAGNGQAGYSGDAGAASNASLYFPGSIAIDAQGTVYFVDQGSSLIRRVTRDGTISTFAGGGSKPFAANISATALALNDVEGIALDSSGNLYISDFAANRIYKVDAKSLVVSNVAGTGQYGNSADGAVAATSPLGNPAGIAIDAAGNIFFDDIGHFKVHKITPDGIVRNFAGNGQAGFSGDGGPALKATFNGNFGLAVDGRSNIYIGDRDNFRIRRVDANQQISTIAGNNPFFQNGPPATDLQDLLLFEPTGVSVAADGRVYIADAGNDVVRRVQLDGSVFTVAGTQAHGFSGDGPATNADLATPYSVGFDSNGNFYIADAANSMVRKVDPSGNLTTLPIKTTPALNFPTAVVFDAAGNMYVADIGVNRIFRVAPDGTASTLAAGVALSYPSALALDPSGNLLVADYALVRRITLPGGVVTTVAGGGKITGTAADGGPAIAAQLGQVSGVAADLLGNIYFTDQNTNLVRKVSPGGILSTIAGNGKAGFSGDGGPPTQASLSSPQAVAVDKAGNVFIADYANDRIRIIYPAPPTFQADKSSLTFQGFAGGPADNTQFVNLSTAAVGLPYTVSVSPAASWLSITPAQGQMPGALSIVADPSQLQAGTYQADITITAAIAVPPTRTIHVTFNVSAAPTTKLSIATTQLSFAFVPKSAPASRTVTIRNGGGGTLTFDIQTSTSNGSNWLKVSAPSGTATPTQPFLLIVTADPTGLAPGTYLGTITLINRTGQDSATIAVTITVSGATQTMTLSRTGLTFTAVQGVGAPPSQTFEVINGGQGSLDWTVSAQTLGSAGGWLSITPNSGTSVSGAVPQPVSVNVQPAGLAPGTYYGSITASSATALNSPQILTVVLRLLAPDQTPPAVVQPAGLLFTGVAGGSNPAAQQFTISNLTVNPLFVVSNRACIPVGNCFVNDPVNATIASGASVTVNVSPQIAGLAAGVYQVFVNLNFSDGTTQTVHGRLILAPSGAGNIESGLPTAAAAGCTPTKLVPLFTTVTDSFSFPASWPQAIGLRVADDCGTPQTSGSVIVNFSNGDAPVRMNPLGDGRWSQSWTPTHMTSTVTLTANAQTDGSSTLTGVTIVAGGLQTNSDPPLITPEGIISAANSSPGAPLPPGGLITLYGLNLADSNAAAASLPLETDLQGVKVVLAGRALPLQYAGSGQINAIIPYDLPTNAVQSLVVLRGPKQSAVVQIPLADTLPAVFTRDGSGKGQGDVLDANNVFYDASHPAKAGDVAVIYCTGLGPVTGSVPAGSASPVSPLSTTINPVTVSIGGVSVKPFFAGLTPGSAGLYQINLIVPAGIAPGNAVPVVVTSGGRSGAPVTMATK